MPRERLIKLAVIGTLAGIFSGLFGVGGGTVVVPLLIFWLGYGEREATGTSLVALTIIATVAAITQGFYGNVDPAKGLAVGIPAIFGIIGGTAFQQRISQRTVALVFAALLVALAIQLLLS